MARLGCSPASACSRAAAASCALRGARNAATPELQSSGVGSAAGPAPRADVARLRLVQARGRHPLLQQSRNVADDGGAARREYDQSPADNHARPFSPPCLGSNNPPPQQPVAPPSPLFPSRPRPQRAASRARSSRPSSPLTLVTRRHGLSTPLRLHLFPAARKRPGSARKPSGRALVEGGPGGPRGRRAEARHCGERRRRGGLLPGGGAARAFSEGGAPGAGGLEHRGAGRLEDHLLADTARTGGRTGWVWAGVRGRAEAVLRGGSRRLSERAGLGRGARRPGELRGGLLPPLVVPNAHDERRVSPSRDPPILQRKEDLLLGETPENTWDIRTPWVSPRRRAAATGRERGAAETKRRLRGGVSPAGRRKSSTHLKLPLRLPVHRRCDVQDGKIRHLREARGAGQGGGVGGVAPRRGARQGTQGRAQADAAEYERGGMGGAGGAPWRRRTPGRPPAWRRSSPATARCRCGEENT